MPDNCPVCDRPSADTLVSTVAPGDVCWRTWPALETIGPVEQRSIAECESRRVDWRARALKAAGALGEINEIRNTIIGTQTVNWSRDIYPLVRALEDAGLKGEGAERARDKAVTLIEQRNRMRERAMHVEAMLWELVTAGEHDGPCFMPDSSTICLHHAQAFEARRAVIERQLSDLPPLLP